MNALAIVSRSFYRQYVDNQTSATIDSIHFFRYLIWYLYFDFYFLFIVAKASKGVEV